jgi:hypothetical protein
MQSHRALRLCASIGLAAPLLAQTSIDPFVHDSTFVFPSYSALGDPPRPVKLLAGQFDGDGLADAVLQLDHRLAYIGAIVARDVVNYVDAPGAGGPLEIVDFDVACSLAGVGGVVPSGLRAAIVYLLPGGLHAAHLDSAGPPLATSAEFVHDPIETARWAGAVLVRAADVDADSVTDFVGLAANRTTVLVTDGASLQTTTFETPDTVLALELLRWDASVELEVALLTIAGPEVRGLDGSVLQSVASPPDPLGVMGVVKGLVRDRVAWIGHDAQGAFLTVLRMGSAPEGPQALPVPEPRAVVSGDVDRDRDGDLLVPHASSLAPLFVRNSQPAVPMFDPAGADQYVDGAFDRIVYDNLGLPSLEQDVGLLSTTVDGDLDFQPLLADLDGDDRCDAVLAAYTPGEVTDHDLALLVFLGAKPGQDPLPPPGGSSLVTCPVETNRIYGAKFELNADTPPNAVLTVDMTYNANTCPAAADTIGVTVWRQATETSPLDPCALHDYRFAVNRVPQGWDPTSGSPTRLEVVVDGDLLSGDTTAPYFCTPEVLWLEIKAMNASSEPPVVYGTRFVAMDMANHIDEVLILQGGVELCHLEPIEECPSAVSGPIYIVRKPRLASPESTANLVIPPAVAGAGSLGPAPQ